MSAKIGRQNRNPKWRQSMRWDTANYDYMQKIALARGVSVAVIANEIIRKDRQRSDNGVPRGALEAS